MRKIVLAAVLLAAFGPLSSHADPWAPCLYGTTLIPDLPVLDERGANQTAHDAVCIVWDTAAEGVVHPYYDWARENGNPEFVYDILDDYQPTIDHVTGTVIGLVPTPQELEDTVWYWYEWARNQN
jgi:hypothetical protein